MMESNKKNYPLKQGGKEYILTTSLLGDKIKMVCKSKYGKSFPRIFTLDEFKSLDKVFYNINSAYEALEYIDNIIRNQKVGVKEENGEIKIIFFLNINGLIHQTDIPLGSIIIDNNFISSISNGQYSSYDNSQNLTDQYTTQIYSNNTYDATMSNNYIKVDNIGYNMGETNNTNELTNQFFESNSLRSKIRRRRNFDGGLEQNETPIFRNSLPLPSFNSNQFLNNYNSPNQNIQNYGLTSIELPISPTPTLPIVAYSDLNGNNQFEIDDININQFNNDYSNNNQFIAGDLESNQYTSENTIDNKYFNESNIENQYSTEDITNQYFTQGTEINQYGNGDIYSNQFNTEDFNTNQYTTESITANPYVTENYNQFNNEETDLSNNYNVNKVFQNIDLSRSLNITQEQNNNNLSEYFSQPIAKITSISQNFVEPQSMGLPSYNQSLRQITSTSTKNIVSKSVQPTTQNIEIKINNLNHSGSPVSLSLPKIEEKSKELLPNPKPSLPIRRTEQRIIITEKKPEKVKFNLTLFQNDKDDKINKLENDANSLKNTNQEIKNKINYLTNQINTYNTQIGLLEREKSENEVNKLRAENLAIKQQLSELNNLRGKAAELNALKAQLSELDPLKKKAAEMEILKAQLREFNDLKRRFSELNYLKSQLGEIDQLKAKVNQMSNLQVKLGEINTLRIQAANTENLRKKLQLLENERLKYEQEIMNLRNSQKEELLKIRDSLESKRLYEERTQNITVKGDIIQNMDELEMITNKINKLNKKITLNLLYKATIDSDKASAFHERCDDAESSIVLIETDKGKRFGGFTTCSWSGDCIDKKDEDAFIFSLDKMMIYENIPGEDAIGCYPKFGPTFLGCQIRIFDNAFTNGGTTFERGLNYNTEEDYELTEGDRVFGVKEIEVYEVIVQ